MTMNKTCLAAIVIALASPLPVSATCHYPIPLSFDMCAENDYCRDVSEQVSERTIDEARWLLENIFQGDASYFFEDANTCKVITSTMGAVMICPPPPDPCPIDPIDPIERYCMGIWEVQH